jgi:hypothetical protein
MQVAKHNVKNLDFKPQKNNGPRRNNMRGTYRRYQNEVDSIIQQTKDRTIIP